VPQQSLESAQRMYEAYRSGNASGILAELHPDVEVVPLPEISGSPYKGHDGMRRLFEDRKKWDLLEFEAAEFRANGDRVAILGRYRARRGGALTDSSAAIAVIVKEGRIIRLEAFTSWESALERCGLGSSEETAAVA
jgi:ketosteroid isomerase-like protein